MLASCNPTYCTVVPQQIFENPSNISDSNNNNMQAHNNSNLPPNEWYPMVPPAGAAEVDYSAQFYHQSGYMMNVPAASAGRGGGLMVPPPQQLSSREMRNRAEKMRRDKLNAFISELASLVPMVARSGKKMDKTSVLRLTATHLRIYQTLLNRKDRPHMKLPKHVDQYILEQLVCEQLGGFLLIMTPNGKIVFVSPTVETLLGHLQTDLMGQSIYNIASPDDNECLRSHLNVDGAGAAEKKRTFNVRLKRAGPRSESAVYESVLMMGVVRPSAFAGGGTNINNNNNNNDRDLTMLEEDDEYVEYERLFCNNNNSNNNNNNNNNVSASSSPSASSTSSCMSSSSSTTTSAALNNSDVLLFFVRIHRPEIYCERVMEPHKDEYVTRHLIDGRIIGCDQRISLIAGYMTEEVTGMSAFRFIHRDDMRWTMIGLRQMYDKCERKAHSCYRLQSRNGQFIFLRTSAYLEVDDQGIVESFVCINTLVDDREGSRLVREMINRYSAQINFEPSPISCSSNDSIQSVEDPQLVDAAIVHLMTNLPSPGNDNPQLPSQQLSQRSTPSPCIYYNSKLIASPTENEDCYNAILASPKVTLNHNEDHTVDMGGRVKSSYQVKMKPSSKRTTTADASTDQVDSNKRQRLAPPPLVPLTPTRSNSLENDVAVVTPTPPPVTVSTPTMPAPSVAISTLDLLDELVPMSELMSTYVDDEFHLTTTDRRQTDNDDQQQQTFFGFL